MALICNAWVVESLPIAPKQLKHSSIPSIFIRTLLMIKQAIRKSEKLAAGLTRMPATSNMPTPSSTIISRTKKIADISASTIGVNNLLLLATIKVTPRKIDASIPIKFLKRFSTIIIGYPL